MTDGDSEGKPNRDESEHKRNSNLNSRSRSDSNANSNSNSVPSVFDRLPRLERRLTSADTEQMLLCLDFDGTLAPHVDDPDSAELTTANRRVLETLASQPAVDIAVISGRALDDVRTRVGMDGLTYAGNHGLEYETGEASVHTPAERYRSTIQAICEELEARLDETDCAVENKGITATVHYRNTDYTAEEIENWLTSLIEDTIEETTDEHLRITSGMDIVEIRPAIDWNKGHAVQQFEEECPDDCISVYLGDDTTDEDAFRAIAPEGISVHVGTNSDTAADYRVSSVDEVTSFLDWIAETGTDALQGDNQHRS